MQFASGRHIESVSCQIFNQALKLQDVDDETVQGPGIIALIDDKIMVRKSALEP